MVAEKTPEAVWRERQPDNLERRAQVSLQFWHTGMRPCMKPLETGRALEEAPWGEAISSSNEHLSFLEGAPQAWPGCI